MHSIWKKDFPALANQQISYLDSAATCQVPQSVIQSISDYLANGQGNAGRGLHRLSENASGVIEACRQNIANFVGAEQEQIIFTKGATESINLVAASMRSKLTSKDSILVTELEHHSNLLPWQQLCQQTGARLNILPLRKDGELELHSLEEMLSDQCQLFAFSHCSNVLGQLTPVKDLIHKAQQYSVKTLLDGAQAISHGAIDLSDIDCDFYAFSGHKLYSTGGSGVLYCKDKSSLNPLLLGGGSATRTTTQAYTLREDIYRFEAGTANQVSLVALSSAIDYLRNAGFQAIADHESSLHQYLTKRITEETSFEIVSHAKSKSLLSFYSEEIHCHDVASVLSQNNIAIRAGHHCAQPCLNALGIKHCLRASLGMYNDYQDIDRLIDGLNLAANVIN